MSTRKNLTMIVAGSLLLSLASCGNNDKSSKKQGPETCSDIDCLSSVNWKINLQGRTFPDKSRVDINGTTVVNECVSKQKFAIDRSTEPQSITLENYYVPKRGELKIDVIDLGHCDSESTFISDDKVNFDVVKGVTSNEILINL